ncbi:extracellular glycosidase Utr2p [Diutina catenulata]
MKFSSVVLTTLAAGLVAAADQIKCSKSNQCPEDQPCCSQFGVCGTGAYCLGGCDPRWSYKMEACMPQPVMESFDTEFRDIKQVKNQYTYLGNSSEVDWLVSGNATIHDDALLLQMPAHSVGVVISSTKYMWYGNVKAKMKTSRGAGVVSAFIIFSDVQDEIDYEMVGSDLTGPQSNYYYQGNLDYKNGKRAEVSDTFENYHEYEIDWQPDEINWKIDGNVVRTLKKEDTKDSSGVYKFPQTPSRVQFSLWPGGDASQGQGTIEWAGGEIDWDSEVIQKEGYYYAYVKDVKIKANDLKSDIPKKGEGKGDYNAFIYTDKAGTENDVALTNAKTYIGKWDATGLDPQNEDKEESSSSSSSSSSKSSSKSESKSESKSSSKDDKKTSSKEDDKDKKTSSASKTSEPKSSSEAESTTAHANIPQGNGPGVQGQQVSTTTDSGAEETDGSSGGSNGGFDQGNKASESAKETAATNSANDAVAVGGGVAMVVAAVAGALSLIF